MDTKHWACSPTLGGKRIRIGGESTPALLDKAQELGFTVTISLWMGHCVHGFDDCEQAADDAQTASFGEIVTRLQDHPAVLMWGIDHAVE